jgi:hypothetical protein
MQQSSQQSMPEALVHPRTFDVFFHLIKTSKLLGALLTDERISLGRKVLFLGSIGFFLVLLIFPDIFGEVMASVVLPVLGTILGIPLDAGFDWIAFALAVVGLLRIFPPEVISDHYQRIFGPR